MWRFAHAAPHLTGPTRRVGRMLRLRDSRTGRPEPVPLVPGGLLRIFAPGPPAGLPGRAGDLRTALLGDLARRVGELHRMRVVVTRVLPAPTGGSGPATTTGADPYQLDLLALNVYPPEATSPAGPAGDTDGPDPPAGGIELRFPGADAARVRRWLVTGPVLRQGHPDPLAVSVSEVRDRGHDPLALRLDFLGQRYDGPLEWDWSRLEAAGRTLARWRAQVARWAEGPSAAMDAAAVGRVVAAATDDLDSPAALALLRGIEEDPELPAGAKFEMFAHLDRLFGLDLAREVGR
jgi:hypothetical protein